MIGLKMVRAVTMITSSFQSWCGAESSYLRLHSIAALLPLGPIRARGRTRRPIRSQLITIDLPAAQRHLLDKTELELDFILALHLKSVI